MGNKILLFFGLAAILAVLSEAFKDKNYCDIPTCEKGFHTLCKFKEWDPELAWIAQRWAQQCTFKTDYCRNVDRFIVGQNIARDSTYGNVEILNVDWAVRKWFEEVNLFNRSDVQYFRQDTLLRTRSWHYTQMVWGNSTKIGCGAVRYLDKDVYRFLLICNYGPAGNRLGKKVYETPIKDK